MGDPAQNSVNNANNLTSLDTPSQKNGENGKGEDKYNKDPLNLGEEKSENVLHSSIIQQYEARIFQLNQQLQDADRRNRINEEDFLKKRRTLEDEVADLKRELAKDNTDTKISNLESKHELERKYEKKLREKEKEIDDLKTEIRFKELELNQGDKDTFDKFMLVFERFADSGFLGKVLEGLQNMQPAGGANGQYSSQQLKSAVNAAKKSEKNAGMEDNSDAELRENSENQNQIPEIPPEDMPKAKAQVKEALLNSAMEALTNKNVNLGHYAEAVRRQIQISKQQGIELDAKQWIQMAKVLAEHAVDREVTPDRVAKVISPVLDGVKKYSFFLQSMEPKGATNALFNYFNIETSEAVKNLVAKTLQAIKQSQ